MASDTTETNAQAVAKITLGEYSKAEFIRQAQLLEILPFSAATLWRKAKSGDFPRPIKLSERITAWKVAEVLEWIAKLHEEQAITQ